MGDQQLAPHYERRLIQEIEDIDRRIRDLEAEKSALRRLLANAKGRDRISGEVIRRNSIDRAVVERAVIASLSSEGHLRSGELYRRVLNVAYPLNNNTFRSHLHRMKEKGDIKNYRGMRGVWELA